MTCNAVVVQDVGELGLCRIALDLGVAGDGITTEMPEKMREEVDLRSQVTKKCGPVQSLR